MALLGRRPLAAFDVVVRRADGTPVVIRNAALLPDGRPMPTRYWLVDPELNRAIGTLESAGGVDRAEADLDPAALAATHARYAAERESAIPANHVGPRPSGGVGGTRVGVKCLHTHYAHFLATGDDLVGAWTARRLPEHLLAIGSASDLLDAELDAGTDPQNATDPEEPAGG